jgi:hypothetical protein
VMLFSHGDRLQYGDHEAKPREHGRVAHDSSLDPEKPRRFLDRSGSSATYHVRGAPRGQRSTEGRKGDLARRLTEERTAAA